MSVVSGFKIGIYQSAIIGKVPKNILDTGIMPVDYSPELTCCPIHTDVVAESTSITKSNLVFDLNEEMDNTDVPDISNEDIITKLVSILHENGDPDRPEFWLLTARFAEAALLCAGLYADNCEYKAVGDLIVNPRRVSIYLNLINFHLTAHLWLPSAALSMVRSKVLQLHP